MFTNRPSSVAEKPRKDSKVKRISHLYEKMLDRAFIKECILLASKGKKRRKQVRETLDDIDNRVEIIYKMVENHHFEFKGTKKRIIPEYKKKREITISPFFPNQIIDYMLVTCLKPLCKRILYEFAVGNVDGKGIRYGKEYLETKTKRYPYFIKLDIHHFYQSVSPRLLMKKLEKRVKDKDFLSFAREVICRFVDLPIGTYYSQWLSNFYIAEVDWIVKQEMKIPVYVRYVDDMVLLSDNVESLIKARDRIRISLEDLGLSLKNEGYVRDIRKTPLSFLGFRFTQKGVWIRKPIIKRIAFTIEKAKAHLCVRLCRRLIALGGWLKQTSLGYCFYKINIRDIIKFGYARRQISNETN